MPAFSTEYMVTLFKIEIYNGQRNREEYETMPSAESFLFSCKSLQRNAWQEKKPRIAGDQEEQSREGRAAGRPAEG